MFGNLADMGNVKSVNSTLADNLEYFMGEKGWNQSDLARASKVSQRSISNYLNPTRRDPTGSGKESSAKLVEISMIAAALGVEIWELVREMTPSERAFYKHIEAAFRDLKKRGPDGNL